MKYVDAFIAAVPRENRQAYLEHAKEAIKLIKEFGATRTVETWGDDIPKGEVTDFFGAVKAKENENIVMSWIEWPSKEVRDQGMKKMMEDPRMQEMEMPFDGKRLIYGGFEPMLDE